MSDAPLLRAEGISKEFAIPRTVSDLVHGRPPSAIHAVDRVSLSIGRGETLGLIGESGSGKSTLGWLVARLHAPSGGRLDFEGEEITHLEGEALRRWRRNVQVVFQDPVSSLDPRLRVWQIVGEPLHAQTDLRGARLKAAVAEILPQVGLPADCLEQYPHEFSGGGRQRLSLARALSVRPKLIVLDEPTSALDVAVQAPNLNRLVEHQRTAGNANHRITPHVSAVRFVADRVAVLYLGRIAEAGPVRALLEHPVHPYTKALLAALPVPDVRRRRARYRITGEIPTLVNVPKGCRFAGRCPFVVARCRVEEPELRETPGHPGQLTACHRAEEVEDIAPETLLLPGPGAGPPAPAA